MITLQFVTSQFPQTVLFSFLIKIDSKSLPLRKDKIHFRTCNAKENNNIFFCVILKNVHINWNIIYDLILVLKQMKYNTHFPIRYYHIL